jgi:lipopolysaccharide export LptBFGC system permease protein LptF
MLKVKYTILSFFKTFIIISVSIVSLFIFIRIIDDLHSLELVDKGLRLWKYLFDAPELFIEMSPIVTFLSGMFFISEMLKYGELKVFEISGINHRKIFYILCVCGLLVSGFAFYVRNYTVPVCMIKKGKFKEVKTINFSSPEYLVYSEKFISPDFFEMVQFSYIKKGEYTQLIKAEKAIYEGKNYWRFENGNLWLFDLNGQLLKKDVFQSLRTQFRIMPEILASDSKNIETLSYVEFKHLLTNMKKFGIIQKEMESYFHERTAYPLLNFFLLFLLLPFFSITKKLARVFVLSISMVLAFVSYGIYAFSFGLATSGRVPPVVGVWTLHFSLIVFLLIFLVKIEKKEKI